MCAKPRDLERLLRRRWRQPARALCVWAYSPKTKAKAAILNLEIHEAAECNEVHLEEGSCNQHKQVFCVQGLRLGSREVTNQQILDQRERLFSGSGKISPRRNLWYLPLGLYNSSCFYHWAEGEKRHQRIQSQVPARGKGEVVYPCSRHFYLCCLSTLQSENQMVLWFGSGFCCGETQALFAA